MEYVKEGLNVAKRRHIALDVFIGRVECNWLFVSLNESQNLLKKT